MNLSKLIEMSREYGSNPDYVLAGGGNTSYKEGSEMAVKASGGALGTITEDGFVLMDVAKLRALTQADYPEEDDAREACAIKDMMAARLAGQGEKRPSVECILHGLFPQAYVLHLHPALVNGLTCGQGGAAAAARLFSDIEDEFVWMPLTKPGFVLSKACAEAFAASEKRYGKHPSVVLLQNHGIFVAGATVEECGAKMADAVARISKEIQRKPDFAAVPAPDGADGLEKALAALYGEAAGGQGGACVPVFNKEVERLTASKEAYAPLLKPFSPDHIVYCRAYPLFLEGAGEAELRQGFAAYAAKYGFPPKVVAVRGVGVCCLGKDAHEAEMARLLFLDAAKIAVYSASFGGALPLPDDFTAFITNWEIESYRQKKSIG
ncbi:MAG: class II aldolase/adducin family protein [Clostridiales Family XIII bacterium]|jgi:rhamnose utilization protein RhaD (predicted bifunctional aldolase and dehydrogenase)|nr:class II aldolase/adducin family protein [Clostridiales Family XIII bacterium]